MVHLCETLISVYMFTGLLDQGSLIQTWNRAIDKETYIAPLVSIFRTWNPAVLSKSFRIPS